MPISLLDDYIEKGKIFEPVSEPKRTKNEKLFRKICSEISGSINTLDCFNNWVDEILPKQVKKLSYIDNDGVKITFDNVILNKPVRKTIKGDIVLYPQYCRERKLLYGGDLEARCTIDNSIDKVSKTVIFGKIPIMLGSNKCNLYGKTPEELIELGECISDPFGYFIIKTERIVIGQDKLRKNIPLIIKDVITKKPIITERYDLSKRHFIAIGQKWNTLKLRDPKPVGGGKAKSIPIFIVYKILDDLEPKEAVEKYIFPLINKDLHKRVLNALDVSIIKAKKENPYEYLYVKKNKYRNILRSEKNFKEKIRDAFEADIYSTIKDENRDVRVKKKLILFSLLVIKMCLLLIGKASIDNRDSWKNKSFEIAPVLLEKLMDSIFTLIMKEIKKENINLKDLNYEYYTNYIKQKSPNIINTNISSSFNTAYWGVKKLGNIQKSTTEQYRRETPLVSWSINSKQTSKSGGTQRSKVKDSKVVQPSQLNKHCPIETPEGQDVGDVKYLSLTGIVSIERDSDIIKKFILEKNNEEKDEEKKYHILINGIPFVNNKGKEILVNYSIYKYLISLKRFNKIPYDSEISIMNFLNIISIFTDSSRVMTPYLIIENMKLKIEEDNKWDEDFQYLISNGYMEMLSATEEDNEDIIVSESFENYKMRYKEYSLLNEDLKEEFLKLYNYTHCVIDPNQMFSIATSTCPYANRQTTPRSAFQASMGKQALGNYNINNHLRFDSSFKILYKSMRSMSETNTYFLPRMDIMPSGQIANIAFLAESDNQEDAIIISEDYINSRKLNYFKYVTIEYTEKKLPPGSVEEFKIPPLRPNQNPRIYRNLEENGFPKLDTYIEKGDCILGKVIKTSSSEENNSVYADKEQTGYVDRVFVTMDRSEQKILVRIKLKLYRKYIAGDKLALRYAQKGTVGRVVSREDMIRVSDGPNKGMSPDIMFNPHGFPTRSTAGLLIEGLATKAGLYNSTRVNCSSFVKTDISEIKKVLKENNLDENGEESFEFPDGEKINNKIYFVPLYEQALRHHVLDKIQVRNTGIRSLATHQPQGGRTRGCGLKFGEMEKDSVVAHGASNVLLDRMMKSSDEYQINVCVECGVLSNNNNRTCKVCSKKNIGVVVVPYVFKLLIHLLMGTGIDVRLQLKKK